MSVRLSVLMVQSPRLSALQSTIQDQLVIELIGSPGIDLAIVSSLDPAEGSATDPLLISSLSADLAVIDWRGPDVVLDLLSKSGLSGVRSPHPLDLKAPQVVFRGVRRIYVFDLRNGDSPSNVVRTLKGLLRDRQVVAIPIGLAAMRKPSDDRLAGANVKRMDASVQASLGQLESVPVDKLSSAERMNDSPRSPVQDSDLDALVDRVNETDW
jgi:hypothetical protein